MSRRERERKKEQKGRDMEVAEELGVDALVETKADDVEWRLHRALLLTTNLLSSPSPPLTTLPLPHDAAAARHWRGKGCGGGVGLAVFIQGL